MKSILTLISRQYHDTKTDTMIFNTLTEQDFDTLSDFFFNLHGIEIEDYKNPSQEELDCICDDYELITEATQEAYENAVPSFIEEYRNYLSRPHPTQN